MKRPTFQDSLLSILELSANRHGENHPLTIGRLKNIVTLAGRLHGLKLEQYAEHEERAHQDALEFAGGFAGQDLTPPTTDSQ